MIVTRLAWTVTCASALASCGWLAGLKSYGLSGDGGGDDAVDAPVGSPMKPTAMFPWNGYDTGAVGAPTAVMPTFTWAEVAGATSYEIELSHTCAVATMQSCDLGTPALLQSATSYTPSTALETQLSGPAGGRWFWRVAACVGAACAWSDVRYLNVGRLANDFDGDGRSDLAIGTATGKLWQFVNGAGSGSAVSGYGSDFGLAVSAGDFNGDGFGDLAVYAAGNAFAGEIVVLFGGDAHSPNVVALGDTPMARFGLMSLCPGDLDGDGFDDLVVITNNSVVGFPGGPDGTSGSAQPVTEMGLIYANGFGAVGDVDGDGFPDFAVASAGGPVTVFYGPLSSGRTTTIDPPDNESPWGAAITGGDIDGDGFSDVIISGDTTVGDGIIYAFHGGPDGVSTTPMQLFMTATSSASFGRALLYRREGTSHALGIGDSGQAWVAYGSAAPSEIFDLQGSNLTFGAALGGGDFAGSGYDSLVVGSIGDDSSTSANACGAAYAYDADQSGAVSGHALDAPDCTSGEEFGVAIGH
jgi:FG-GAP-like repeat/FG-GAP repeat